MDYRELWRLETRRRLREKEAVANRKSIAEAAKARAIAAKYDSENGAVVPVVEGAVASVMKAESKKRAAPWEGKGRKD